MVVMFMEHFKRISPILLFVIWLTCSCSNNVWTGSNKNKDIDYDGDDIGVVSYYTASSSEFFTTNNTTSNNYPACTKSTYLMAKEFLEESISYNVV